MISLENLRRKLDNTEQLHSVVRTMKVIAAININQFQEAVSSLADYHRNIEMGLQIVLKGLPEDVYLAEQELSRRTGVIMLGSDQGMVGQFNQVVVTHVVKEMSRLKIRPESCSILGMGIRGVTRLEQRGLQVDQAATMPGSLSGVTPAVQDVLLHIRDWREEQDVEQVFVFYNTFQGGASYEPTTMQLLPVFDGWLRSLQAREWPNKVAPTFRGDWREIFAQLIQQVYFISIYRAMIESLASENASRLAAMQVAEKNIEDRLDEISLEYNQLRQSSITNELLDVITGAEALRQEN